MRKIIVLFIVFFALTVIINSCSIVTEWDRVLIMQLQKELSFLPKWLPMLPDCVLYTVMIVIPLLVFGIFFIYKKMYKDILFLYSIPLVTYILNFILKHIIKRPRPPYELQIANIHPDSFSYVSSHSLVTICLWGMVIWYLQKYCKYKFLRITGIIISIIWILFVGLSRIWIGVHNPTDVLSAYMLGIALLLFYKQLRNYLN